MKFSAAKKVVLAVLVLAGFALLAWPAPEPGFHGFHPRIQGLYIVSFLLVALPLVWWVGPRLKEFLDTRYATIRNEVEEARHQFQEAEDRLKQTQARLAGLSAEIEALMNEFRSLGEKERDALAHEGAVLSERIRAETDFAMSQAVKMAHQELRRLLAMRAVEAVSNRFESEKAAGVPDPLVERFAREAVHQG